MTFKKPDFKSNIPEYLLSDSTARDRYIMEQLSIISQQNSWQSEALSSLDERVAFANSKTSKAIMEIEELQKKGRESDSIKEDVAEVIETKRLLEKYILNKRFLIIFGIFFIGFLKILAFPTAVSWISSLIG